MILLFLLHYHSLFPSSYIRNILAESKTERDSNIFQK